MVLLCTYGSLVKSESGVTRLAVGGGFVARLAHLVLDGRRLVVRCVSAEIT